VVTQTQVEGGKVKLTKRTIDAARYEGDGNARCVLWDDEVPGFGCRVYPGGRKAFILSYRADGRKRLLTVGTYGVLTLDQARTAARSELAKVEVEGADPVEARRQRADEAATLEPLRTLLDEYTATLTNEGTAADARQTFTKNIPARIASKPARDVTTMDVEGILAKVRERGALAVERNLFRFLHAAFEFGTGNQDRKRRFRIAGNPATDAERPDGSAPAGHRELSAAEIRDLWQRLDAAGLSLETATALRLQVLTGQRVQEILSARWSEIDFERRILDIPAERLKTGEKTKRGHVVPLPDMALELLAALPRVGACVFPRRGDPDSPMQWRSLSQAVDRLTSAPDSTLAKFTPRDLRRTVKTRLSEIGVLKEIRDRVQNHALHDVASKHYDRYDFLPDKRAALEGWQWEVRRILADKPLSDDWRKWLRRFVKDPDNDMPGRQLARLFNSATADTVATPADPSTTAEVVELPTRGRIAAQ
jgi:integrase